MYLNLYFTDKAKGGFELWVSPWIPKVLTSRMLRYPAVGHVYFWVTGTNSDAW